MQIFWKHFSLLISPKTKNLNWLHHATLKYNLSKTRIEQSMESNSFEKFKVIASLPILRPYFSGVFFKKRKISQKTQYNLDMGA